MRRCAHAKVEVGVLGALREGGAYGAALQTALRCSRSGFDSSEGGAERGPQQAWTRCKRVQPMQKRGAYASLNCGHTSARREAGRCRLAPRFAGAVQGPAPPWLALPSVLAGEEVARGPRRAAARRQIVGWGVVLWPSHCAGRAQGRAVDMPCQDASLSRSDMTLVHLPRSL
jgi:hypothetical protein